MRTTRRQSNEQPAELNLQPIMGLMVVLIPVLLVSVNFSRFSLVDMRLSDRGAHPDIRKQRQREPSATVPITMLVGDSTIVFGAGDGFHSTLVYERRSIDDNPYSDAVYSTKALTLIGGEPHPMAGSFLEQVSGLLGEVAARLRDEPQLHPLIIASETTVRYDTVIRLMDAARQAGLEDISLTRRL